jgi:hypothetical protein
MEPVNKTQFKDKSIQHDSRETLMTTQTEQTGSKSPWSRKWSELIQIK